MVRTIKVTITYKSGAVVERDYFKSVKWENLKLSWETYGKGAERFLWVNVDAIESFH